MADSRTGIGCDFSGFSWKGERENHGQKIFFFRGNKRPDQTLNFYSRMGEIAAAYKMPENKITPRTLHLGEEYR
jgi:hypothetical protein